MRQLTASEASNDEMHKERERYHHFYKWWSSHENKELRKSCATGWGFHIWQAALKSKQGEYERHQHQ